MDRFFSKLDLRDIKIDPFKTSYPPDADETESDDEAEASEEEAPVEAVSQSDIAEPAPAPEEVPARSTWSRPERQPHVPSWAATDQTDPVVEAAPAASSTVINGHAEAMPADIVAPDAGDEERMAPAAAPAVVNDEILKVSARSRPSAVAGAIAGVVREIGRAEVQAIGAGATNQAVKAVAIARDYLLETGIEAICLPAFIDVTIENEDRTAIRLVVEPR